jgi:hypothetical protein
MEILKMAKNNGSMVCPKPPNQSIDHEESRHLIMILVKIKLMLIIWNQKRKSVQIKV